jgi:two-component system, NtrC family, sensor histidine kinase HydH
MVTNRRIMLQVTLPAVFVGILVCGSCVVGVWSINQLQFNRNLILTKHVRSQKMARLLEVRLRQLRFHSFMYVLDPTPERWALVQEDEAQVEAVLTSARELSSLPGEPELIEAVEDGFRRYRAELQQATQIRENTATREQLLRWADNHPVRQLLEPCEQLLALNQKGIDSIAEKSEAVGSQARWTLILLGVLGSAGGVLAGFGVAWGLSRSITRLRIRLQGVSDELEQDAGSVGVVGEGDPSQLERLLEHVTARIREMVARSQQQQQEILRAEQLAAVGQLAANVAHEVRNPLTGIKLLVGAALRANPPRPLSTEDLNVIHDEVNRLERTVQTLLDFTRPSESVRVKSDLREGVRRSIELVKPRLRQIAVRAEVELPDEPVIAEVDIDQFTSVIVNLVLNSLDAMPQGGTLTVCMNRLASGVIQLTVSDTGTGIAPSVLSKLFTPFTSTKPTGTGLGLSVCQRVVTEHGGTLTGENRPEGGARFTITLPTSVKGQSDGKTPGCGR